MSFPKARVTDAGKEMIARTFVGDGYSIKFTRFDIGSGRGSENEEDWDAYTDLVNHELYASLTTYLRDGSEITLGGEFSNTNVSTEFNWSEIGILGVLVDDQEHEGTETLMFYGCAPEKYAEFAPDIDAPVAVTHRWSTKLTISSATEISAMVSAISCAYAQVLLDHINDTSKHPTDAEAIGGAPKWHAVPQVTYGPGDATNYGHLRLYAGLNSDFGVNSGYAATPSAIKAAMEAAGQAQSAANEALFNITRRGYPTEYGKYVGTNKNGAGNKNSIRWTNGIPKVVVILETFIADSILDAAGDRFVQQQFAIIMPLLKRGIVVCLDDNLIFNLNVDYDLAINTIYWYSDRSPRAQLNAPILQYSYAGVF